MNELTLRVDDPADMAAFYQLFVSKELDCLKTLEGIETMVDCHAHVGLFSRWAIMNLGVKSLLAFEPQRDNFEILKKNIPFGLSNGMPAAINAGIWGYESELGMADGTNSMNYKIFAGGTGINGFPISYVFDLGFESIDLLRINIPGAEVVSFSKAEIWLKKTKNIFIKFYSENGKDILFEKLNRSFSYTVIEVGRSFLIKGIMPKW